MTMGVRLGAVWPVGAAGGRAITIPLSCHHVRRPDEGRVEVEDVDEERAKDSEEEPDEQEDGDWSHHLEMDVEYYTEGGTILELDAKRSEIR